MKKFFYLLIVFTNNLFSQTNACFNSSENNAKDIGGPAELICEGDFNNDTYKDIAVARGATQNQIVIYLGNNLGNFSAASYTCNLPTIIPLSLTTAKINNDGFDDLVITDYLGSLIVLVNNTVGTFTTSYSQGVGSTCYATVADFNNDLKTDIIITNAYSPNYFQVLIGNGAGSFTAGYSQQISGSKIASNDFNNDGNKDIVIVSTSNLIVLLGTGTGSFSTASSNPFAALSVEHGITCNDFNNDGKIDIALSSFSGSGSNRVYIYLGQGTGTFLSGGFYGISNESKSITSNDFNNDGFIDICGQLSLDRFFVLFNNGLGKFKNEYNFSAGVGTNDIISLDYNSDGNNDIITANKASNSISFFTGVGNGEFNSFKSFGKYKQIGADYFYSISSSDLNCDNKKDLVTACLDSISVSFNNEGSGLWPEIKLKCNGIVKGLATADFNGDNLSDIVVYDDGLRLFLNTCSTSFSNVVIYNSNTPSGQPSIHSGILTSDVNSDNKIDLILIDYNAVKVLLGDGNGGFNQTNSINIAGLNCGSAVINDFNKDGNVDIVASTYSTTIVFSSGNGNGTFNPPIVAQLIQTSGHTTYLSNGDLNKDGNMDIVCTIKNYGGSSTAVVYGFAGQGDGTFGPANYFGISVGLPNTSSVLEDFNSDGYLDLLVASQTSTFTPIPFSSYTINGLSFYYLSNTGTMTSSKTLNVESDGNAIISSDINNDGVKDIITSTSSDKVSLILNQSSNVLSVNSNTICSFGSAVLKATKGLSSYNWHPGGALNTDSLVVTSSGSYYVTINNANNTCSSNSNTVSVVILTTPSSNPYSVLTISGNTIICAGNNNILSVTGASTYTWSSGIVSPSITITPTINSIYSVIGTNSLGCPSSQSISVNVKASPTLITIFPNSVCIGSVVNCSVSGAQTYTWSSGLNTPTISSTPAITTSYSVSGTNTVGCTSNKSFTVVVNPIPVLGFTGSNSLCVGSSNNLNTTGASTYTWNTGATTSSINITPTITTTYSVVGTNTAGCSNTQTVTVIVDNTCADVWPGDANSDGLADNVDVLELGLHYTQTGTPRASTGNLWQSYYSTNWAGTITNGKNVNHSNCNGDGVINDNDTLAIFNNYNLTHAFRPEQTTTNPQLTIVPDQPFVDKGNWGTASIYLGDATTTITNINGVAFTVNYDNSLIDLNSIWIEYQTSFINAGNQNLNFRKLDFSNNKLYTATTHTITGNVSGYGKIATLHYKIKPTLATDAVLNLSVSQANQSNASGIITPLTAGSASLMAIGASVGINSQFVTPNSQIVIYPNPTTGILNVKCEMINENTQLEITNAIGQVVFTDKLRNQHSSFNISNFSNGVYFINLYQDNRIVEREKVMVNR